MSLPVTLLAASATIERVVWVIVLLTVALLCLGSRRRLGGSLALDVDTERVAMAIIVVWVLLSRLLAYASPRQPRLYWSEVGPLHITDWLGAPGLAGRWLGQLANVQVIYEHQSPLMAPVAAAMQLALGPSIELPACIGAVWAVLAVVLAWRLGRSAESSTFGVLFSALLAASPLQLTWSRLGGIYIGSPRTYCWCSGVGGSSAAAEGSSPHSDSASSPGAVCTTTSRRASHCRSPRSRSGRDGALRIASSGASARCSPP